MLGGGGGQPRPGIPALALGAGPGGADLPAAGAVQQPGHRLRAGHGDLGCDRELEGGGNPQHIPLAVVFQELAQFGAASVDLIAADEVEGGTVGERLGEDTDGQLPLGAEHQAGRQAHDHRFHRVGDVFGRDPLPGADQRVPGPLPHIRHVHRGDPVGHLAHTPQVVPFDTCRRTALLDLASLIDRPDRQAPPSPPPGRLIQPSYREPAHHPHRGEGIPGRAVEQPLRPLRLPVPCPLRDRPAVPLGQLADQGSHVLARLQPRPRPHKTRPQQSQQLTAFPGRHRGPYPGGSSRLRFCCCHERMIDRRLRRVDPGPSAPSAAGQTSNGCCRTRGSGR